MACLGAIEELGWPLDRIVHAEIWATDTIPADLPPMIEFKAKADAIIKERWGIEVEHVRADYNFESRFYKRFAGKNPKYVGKYTGWPAIGRNWCNSILKVGALKKAQKGAGTIYIGIASDEPKRFHNLSARKRSPLVEAGWTEADCQRWCEGNDLLSPIYTTAGRGGCWFCYNQRLDQFRSLRKNYPEYWALMLKWDKDSPVTFTSSGRTVHDYDRRFAMEDAGLVPTDKRFRWSMLEEELNYRWF